MKKKTNVMNKLNKLILVKINYNGKEFTVPRKIVRIIKGPK